MSQSLELLKAKRLQLQNELDYSQRRISKSILLQNQLQKNIDDVYLKIVHLDKDIQTLEKAHSNE